MQLSLIVIRPLRALLLLLATSAIATTSQAQMGMGPGLANFEIEYNVALLMNPTVQKDIKLSPAASQQAQQALMRSGMKMMQFMGKTPTSEAERKKMTSEMMSSYKVMERDTVAHLNPGQRFRLRQLTLQSLGANAVIQPKVAAALGLSPAQKTKLSRSFTEIARTQYSSYNSKPGAGQDYKAMFKDLARKQKAAQAKSDQVLAAVLTSTQKAKWKSMLGKHLDLQGVAGMGSMFGG